MTAVVVEDDPDIRALLEALLAPMGYTVHVAADGAEALRLADRVHPDLVTLDLGLPDMDGLEVARRLRSRCDASLVVVSARPDAESVAARAGVAVDGFVLKPFRPAEVRERLRQVLDAA
ncbi:MAG: response regulator transcription factor [Nocardioidaceae bacterium]|nr:response regulator transcription factor [Nocardioidaceae bacterium]